MGQYIIPFIKIKNVGYLNQLLKPYPIYITVEFIIHA